MPFPYLVVPFLVMFTALVPPAAVAAPAQVYLGSGPTAKNRDASVGVNLHDPQSWNPGLLFVDMAIKGRKWISHSCADSTWDNGKPIQTDSNGWVTWVPTDTCPGMIMVNEPDSLLGTYVVIWEGEGTLAAQMGPAAGLKCTSSACSQTGPGGLQARSSGSGPHRATFELKTQSTTVTDLRILAFNAKRPIKNIRVLVPGGVPGTASDKLDYFRYCKSARGPFSANELNGTSALQTGETCFDFEQVYWDRFQHSLTQMHNKKVVFHPLTLASLQNFRLLRAMDWMHTNDSPIQYWSERTQYRHQNQVESNHGLAFEYLVELANVLGADLWVNIPHLANDSYIQSMATFLYENVHPGLKVYSEFSNELWNHIFKQTVWAEAQAKQRYPTQPSSWDAWIRFLSDKSVQVADTFRKTFAASPKRLVNVLSGQAVSPGSAEAILQWNNAKTHFDAYAIAPYFGYEIGEDANLPNYNVDKVFEIVNNTAIPAAQTAVRNNVAMLAKLQTPNLRLITYEAGQHLVAYGELQNNQTVTDLLTAANRDARMGAALDTYLRALRTEGLNEICYYQHISLFNKFGSWGLWERETDTAAPKWNAINNFRSANPCWWNNCTR